MLAGWRAVQENADHPAMALGRPVDGPGIPEQIHGAVPTALLGGLLRSLARGAQTPAAPGPVPGVAGEPDLRPARLDLELRSNIGSPFRTWPATRGLSSAWKPTLRYLGEFLGAEAGLLNPIFFVATVWAAIAFWRRGRHDPRLVYFFSMGAPLFLAYLLYSFRSRMLPNWIAPSVLPLFCLMVIYWDTRWRLGAARIKPWLISRPGSGIRRRLLVSRHQPDPPG